MIDVSILGTATTVEPITGLNLSTSIPEGVQLGIVYDQTNAEGWRLSWPDMTAGELGHLRSHYDVNPGTFDFRPPGAADTVRARYDGPIQFARVSGNQYSVTATLRRAVT